MNLFDQLKVPVPFAIADLEKTIKAIQERKEYYLNPTDTVVTPQAPQQEEAEGAD